MNLTSSRNPVTAQNRRRTDDPHHSAAWWTTIDHRMVLATIIAVKKIMNPASQTLFFRFLRIAVVALALGCTDVRADDADADWQAVTVLDAGPQEKARSPEELQTMVATHLARQERALGVFLTAHPEDRRVFEARLRLARLLQIRADWDPKSARKLRVASEQLLDELEKNATPAQRVEVDFARITRLMRNLREVTPTRREELLAAARKFQKEHPDDRRLSALLAEVATLFDAQPKIKEALLTDAQPLATNDELKARIADDLKRVRLLGTELALSFTSVQGREIKLADWRGRPVLIVFFAALSEPSLDAVTSVRRALADLPPDSVRVLGVSLDEKRATLQAVMKARAITWPVAFDGQGWESPLVRALGINAVPTVWLIDARGRLRTLNALDGTAAEVRQLLQER